MGISGTQAYALSLKKVKGLASGFDHAVRTGDNTFDIYFIDGSKVSLTIPLPADGVSIVDLVDNGDGTFKAKLSNNTYTSNVTIPQAEVEVSAESGNALVKKTDGLYASGGSLAQSLTATNEIGSVTAGKTYAQGTLLETIVRDILIKEEAPTVTLALTPTDLLYDAVDGEIATIKLTATVTKKTYDVAKVEFYCGTTLIHTETTSVGGTFSYQYTPSTPIKATTVWKVVATDVKAKSSNATKTTTFIGKSYYGTVGDIDTIDEATIKGLSSTLKNSKIYEYKNITMVFGKVLYAYPSTLGALTSIKDELNNINYTGSFTTSTITVDGILYRYYLLTEATGCDDVTIKFA